MTKNTVVEIKQLITEILNLLFVANDKKLYNLFLSLDFEIQSLKSEFESLKFENRILKSKNRKLESKLSKLKR